uniref:Uncharacterized protein n=1 Tax=Neogobius melanostomus TaxID=47308 RepID=A0A8C6U1Z6_9GOBI
VAEDHGLSNSEAGVKAAECIELVLLLGADHKELFDGVQSLLLAPQFDDVGFRDNTLCKPPHRVLKGGREQQHLAIGASRRLPLYTDALVLMALSCDHHIGLVQNKHRDLFGVDHFEFDAPVHQRAWSPNNNLLLHSHFLTSVAANRIRQFNFRIKFPHLLDHLTDLKSQLIRGSETKALKQQTSVKTVLKKPWMDLGM